MSENIQSISQGTYTIGQTSATNFIAGPGISIDSPSAGTVRIGNDETVLWSGTTTTGCTLSEYAANFDKVQVTYYSTEGGTARPFITEFPATALSWNFIAEFVGYNNYLIRDIACYSSNDCINYVYERGSHGWYDISQVRAGGNSGTIIGLTKVVGINRKEV